MALTEITKTGSYAWVRGTVADVDHVRGTPKCWPLSKTTAYVPPELVGTGAPPAPPVVTEYSPSSGSAAGGDTLVIAGTGLTGSTGVTFDGTAGIGFAVGSDAACVVTTPPHAAGVVPAILLNPRGNAAGTFTYV